MRWPDVMEAVTARLRGDFLLTRALGGEHVYRTGEHTAPHVPSVGWFLVSDVEEENTNPLLVQIDVFAVGIEQAATIEGRVRALLHYHDQVATIEGVRMWSQLEGARDNADPEPGFVHRSLDFRFTPARED